MAEFHKKGEVTDHVATADITGGQLILLANGQVGLAPVDIADTKTDSLQTQGFISIPKLDGQQIKAGLPVGYDADADPADGVAGSGAATVLLEDADMVPGSAVYTAEEDDTEVIVNLNVFNPKYPYFPERVYETYTGTTAKTLDAEDNGKVFQLTGDAGALTLMAIATPQDIIIQNMATDGDALVSLSPNANDRIFGMDIAGNEDKDLQNTKATAAQGDWVHVVNGGTAGYQIIAMVGTWATQS